MTLLELVMIPLAFLSGALPFSVWVIQWGTGKDPRDYGDGNPGAFNAVRAGGLTWGGLALMLDVTKGAFPVGLARYIFEIEGLPLAMIAVAPLLGHAFSPFLNFKGGKTIATTGGVWIGLTLWTVPLVGITTLVMLYLLLTSSAWATMFTISVMAAFLFATGAENALLTVVIFNWGLLLLRHWRDLRRDPIELRALSPKEANGTS